MNVIVPIHLEALRVAPSSTQKAKTALYDFSSLGTQPASSMGDLIASNRFETAETSLSTEPGVHLHWTLPSSYTRGVQDEASGEVRYPVLPNRWVIVRYFKDNTTTTNNTRTRVWVMESDTHTEQADPAVKKPTAIPWMNDPNDLQGVQGNFAGRTIDLGSGTWTEPTQTLKALAASAGENGFLGEMFQATYGYGETFTAFYPNCNQVLGLWDKLDDYFTTSSNQLEMHTDFSVSYAVMGWVSDTAADQCNLVVTQAIDAYNAMSDTDKPTFADYLQGVFSQDLGWSMSGFDGVTPETASSMQGVMSGILADIEWAIAAPGNPSYPSALPSADGVQVAIGNNTAEAVSAYIAAVESSNPALQSGNDVTSNIEWLLNALQYGQLPKLSAGSAGVGQLESFLHSTAFANVPGGYQWSVRQKTSGASPSVASGDNQIPLPSYLAQVLSQLNLKQQSLDGVRDDIDGQRKQLFFDWVQHITALNTNVVHGTGNLSDDNSGAFVVDGLFQLYPQFMQAGSYLAGDAPTAPYAPQFDSFQIAIPDTFPSVGQTADGTPSALALAQYTFNTGMNAPGGALVSQLLELGFGMDQTAGIAFPAAVMSLNSAQELLWLAQLGGVDTNENIANAAAAVGDAGKVLAVALASMTALSDAQEGLAAQQSVLDAAKTSLTGYVAPQTGLFGSYLFYTPDPGKAPLAVGDRYAGKLKPPFTNLESWDPVTSTGFIGVKAQMDRFAGQGGSAVCPVDISVAALYLGYAYFFISSPLIFSTTSAYYLQLCEYELTQALDVATSASSALGSATTTLGGAALAGLVADLNTVVATTIPAILGDLSSATPDVAAALAAVGALLAPAGSAAPSIPDFQDTARGADWQTLRTLIAQALESVAGRLSTAQQVSIWNTFLNSKVSALFELSAAPADYYQSPSEPVILLAQQKDGQDTNELLGNFARNGNAAVLPCRWQSEIVSTASAPGYPSVIAGLSTSLNPKISGLSTVLQALAEEAFLLTPELSSVVSAETLKQTALANQTGQESITSTVTLAVAPTGLTGLLPYYIAYNWRDGGDPFLPLFIWWSVDYRFSKDFNFASQSYPANFLSQFQLGEGDIELQPTQAAMANFAASTTPYSNSFKFHGLIALSSAATLSLCDQIRTYCVNYLGYDPQGGPPLAGTTDYEEKLSFYDAYNDYSSRNILSQGLSGFNAGLITRAQELQIPINIPQSWTSANNYALPLSELWPTSLLHGQSLDWPIEWNDEGPNPNASANGQALVYFNPLRAGFLDVTEIVLVDAFGRSVTIDTPNPTAISETMQADQPVPDASHSVYLAPRLVQPTRLNFQWQAAQTVSGIHSYMESGDQVAASPICGWLWPNHLDDSLMLYDAAGRPMGSLRTRGTQVHWFPVPGETTKKGADNRSQMLEYFAGKVANPVFSDFVSTYLYPDSSPATDSRFENFLEVLRQAQQFIVTPAMQQDASLSVLMGSPLVITQASLSMVQKGVPYVGLNALTYPAWDGAGPQFEISSSAYIPYNFGNFNSGAVSSLEISCRIGMAEIEEPGGTEIPYFDDGVAGYFLGEDWDMLYTPVNMPNSPGITSVAAAGSSPLVLTPDGSEKMLTLVMDPRAAVHATTGVLPLKPLSIPPELYAQALAQLRITFLTAPVLKTQNPPALPLPAERGYSWSWVEVGAEDVAILPAQGVTDAVFPQTPQTLVDGWLKLGSDSKN